MSASAPVPDQAAQAAAGVGQRIKAVRRSRRLTIEAVAESSGLTKSFLSKVERGRATASVAALQRVSQALGIPMSSLFENSSTRQVMRAGDYPRISVGGHGIVEYLLTPTVEQRVQVMMSRIEPGGGTGGELHPLPGEVEFAYVIEGALSLTFTDGVVRLGKGDALTFDPALHHSFEVPVDSGPTTVMWMICPAPTHEARRA